MKQAVVKLIDPSLRVIGVCVAYEYVIRKAGDVRHGRSPEEAQKQRPSSARLTGQAMLRDMIPKPIDAPYFNWRRFNGAVRFRTERRLQPTMICYLALSTDMAFSSIVWSKWAHRADIDILMWPAASWITFKPAPDWAIHTLRGGVHTRQGVRVPNMPRSADGIQVC